MNSKGKVLYLSYDGLTDPLGQSQILPYIIGLSSRGYSFSVITFEKEKAFAPGKDDIEKICTKNKIEWIPLTYHKKPPVLSTLFDIWILWQQVKRNYRQQNFQIIHCRSYVTSLVGLLAKRKWGVKFIFDMRGFWADERVEGGLWKLSNPLFNLVYRFFKRKEKEFLQEADQTISLTYNAKEEIESWKIKHAPITVIPTCVDLDLFDPEKINREDQSLLRSKLGITDKDFVLLYLGSWGTWYLTNEMFDFFGRLRQLKPNSKFLIVSGDKVDLANSEFKSDIIVTKAPREQVPLHISLANASVCFIKPSFSKKASSATKMGEIMAMNVPVIANEGWGDVDLYHSSVPDYVVVNQLVVEPRNVAGQAREFAQRCLSLAQGIEEYSSIYQELLAKES